MISKAAGEARIRRRSRKSTGPLPSASALSPKTAMSNQLSGAGVELEPPLLASGRALRARFQGAACNMKAALLDRYGDNSAVRVTNVPTPTIGDTDLLVEVRAASVNPLDVKTREGKVKVLLKYRLPIVLG